MCRKQVITSCTFARNLSPLSANALVQTIKLYMLGQVIVKNVSHLIVLKDLIDCINRVLYYNFEVGSTDRKWNARFLTELLPHVPTILKLGKLQFTEIVIGRILHPDKFPRPNPNGQEGQITADEELKQELASQAEQ